jgi:ABC-2 type transport system ATP-binding protein
MNVPLITVEALTKTFVQRHSWWKKGKGKTEFTAVKDLSFSIETGEFVGFLGPNGAGKSTTIKMMTGILTPTSGTVRVCDLSPSRDRVALARRIGVVFGQRTQLWWDLPLYESYNILRAMYRIDEREFRARMALLQELLDLSPFLSTPVRQLSLGQRMRAELAGALLHQPSVLFLDEPTIGLDVNAKHAIRQFLRDLNRDHGTTIILTTHDMADVEELCERIVLIHQGGLVYDGSLLGLHERYGVQSAIFVEYEVAPMVTKTELSKWRQDGIELTVQEGEHTCIAEFDRRVHSAAQVLDRLRAFGEMRDFSVQEPKLESVIQTIYSAQSVSQV